MAMTRRERQFREKARRSCKDELSVGNAAGILASATTPPCAADRKHGISANALHNYRGEPVCQSIAGPPVDQAVSMLIAEEMTPMAVELALEVRREIQARHEEADRLRCRAIERAQIEADLAQRRFMLVDPNNRLVADMLEGEWNDKHKEGRGIPHQSGAGATTWHRTRRSPCLSISMAWLTLMRRVYLVTEFMGYMTTTSAIPGLKRKAAVLVPTSAAARRGCAARMLKARTVEYQSLERYITASADPRTTTRFGPLTHRNAFPFAIVDRVVGFAGPAAACQRTRLSSFEVTSNPKSLGPAQMHRHPAATKSLRIVGPEVATD